jgi:hypothetical protein
MSALCDVIDHDQDFIRMKHVVAMRVTDLPNRLPRDLVVIQLRLGGDFSTHDHQVALGVGFARHPAVRILRQAGVQHRIGNGIAHFVRMALADGLGRKNIVFAHYILLENTVLNIILTYQDKMIHCFGAPSTAFSRKVRAV